MVELEWKAEAKKQAMLRAPLLSAARAEEMAENLHSSWADKTPAHAVGLFFAFLPPGWKGAAADRHS